MKKYRRRLPVRLLSLCLALALAAPWALAASPDP